MSEQQWAVWHHPIVRFKVDPIPVIGRFDNRADAEDLYFRTIEREDVDEFYVEFGPCDEDGQPKDVPGAWDLVDELERRER